MNLVWGELHEQKEVIVSLPEIIQAGKGNRILRELGATLHYDVYSFEAQKSEIWQSESLLYLRLRENETEVDAQENFNEIRIIYPLATRPSSDQSAALSLINKIVSSFKGSTSYQGQSYNSDLVQRDWDSCNDYLLKEWGEESGSKSLRMMIEENNA
jgi:hypothetical protein